MYLNQFKAFIRNSRATLKTLDKNRAFSTFHFMNINPQDKEELITKILWTLESRRFASWYNSGNFDAYISGFETKDIKIVEKGSDRDENLKVIRKDIEKMFGL